MSDMNCITYRDRPRPAAEASSNDKSAFDKSYNFITTISSSDPEDLRAWMLFAMILHTRPLLVGSLSTLLSVAVIMAMTGRTWPLAWLAADIVLTAYRLKLIRTLHVDDLLPARRRRSHALIMLCGGAWGMLYGMGAGGAAATGLPALMVLGALNVAGAVGTISMRNAGAPRFGILVMSACVIPYDVGLALAPAQHMTGMAMLVPLLTVSFWFVTYQNTKLLVRTFEAERALAELARIDPLTGLANRKSLDEALDDFALRRAEGSPAGLTVICLDLDGFKAVNDTFGHSAGDKLLKVVAERLRAATREGDSVFRLGGDEFVCLLPGTDADDVERLSRRLIDAISRHVEVQAGQFVQVGVSIGGAMVQSDDDAVDAVIERADAALYDAKRAGTNQYRLYR
ncbi:GGDEF domain-containing protein [Methylobacterium terricola]|uniref:diguanylate cyclase n=1 Tax=Methylobacterium terricola TaxID=2583531 RepID=A0A5C4LCN4_9HYPH|nr:GGDEF domain-containing protein [Methylobacterium terricola]TNC10248.1 GGDEF domain-containing protein [Methylobacterium terricola]